MVSLGKNFKPGCVPDYSKASNEKGFHHPKQSDLRLNLEVAIFRSDAFLPTVWTIAHYPTLSMISNVKTSRLKPPKSMPANHQH